MDTLYIGDIPLEFKYAIFNNGYIDLYNTSNPTGNNVPSYRIYTNNGGFYYTYNNNNIMGSRTAQEIIVTDNVVYRSDFPSIMFMTFGFAIFGIFLFNILTSVVRKGGLLGGLL